MVVVGLLDCGIIVDEEEEEEGEVDSEGPNLVEFLDRGLGRIKPKLLGSEELWEEESWSLDPLCPLPVPTLRITVDCEAEEWFDDDDDEDEEELEEELELVEIDWEDFELERFITDEELDNWELLDSIIGLESSDDSGEFWLLLLLLLLTIEEEEMDEEEEEEEEVSREDIEVEAEEEVSPLI